MLRGPVLGAQHTTASCSFSSWRWRSAAVSGRGCRSGPGPGPTPLLSPIAVEDRRRADRVGELGPLTALWFEGRMFSEGEPGTGGGGICWVDERRDEVARKWGDGGTELRSGMAISWFGTWGFERELE